MAKKAIRSAYIQQAIGDSNQLTESMRGVMEESLSKFLGEGVKRQVRQIINEGTDDEFEVEEVNDTEEGGAPAEGGDTNPDTDADAKKDTDGGDAAEGEGGDAPAEGDGGATDPDPEGGEGDGAEGGDDVWAELEQYRGEDGEYDLTKCEDGDCVMRVLKVMGSEDGIRVVDNEDGSVTLTDDNTNQEYIIDIDGTLTGGEGGGEVSEGATNLGYTDSYQNKTAMTTPSNNEPANPSTTYSMDKGVPTGTEKPYAGDGDKAPFNQNVSESDDTIEIQLDDDENIDEVRTTQEQGAFNRGVGRVNTNSNPKAARGRNAHFGGQQQSGTGESSYSPQVEAIMRKANEVFMENKRLRKVEEQLQQYAKDHKELREVHEQLKQRFGEAIVATRSFGNMFGIMLEHPTTREEKIQLLQDFTKATTIKESDAICESVKARLKASAAHKPSINLGNVQPAQISESRNLNGAQPSELNEPSELQATLSLIDRMDSVY